MSFISSIRKGITKLATGADEAVVPESKPKAKPDGDAEGPIPVRTESSSLEPAESSFNIPRSKEVLEGMAEDPPPNIMEMGRPDDGNLNLNQFGDDPELRQIADLVNEKQERFKNSPARKVVTHEETIRKSQDLKVLRNAINKDFDVGYNPEEIVALGRMNKQTTVKLKDEARRIIDDAALFKDISDEELVKFAEIENLAVTTQQLITDAGAVTGRTLGAFNIIKKVNSGKRYEDAVQEIIDLGGGRLSIEQRMRAYSEGKSIADVNKILDRSMWDRSWETILSLRYNAMLSGPSTHLANMIGSATSTIWENVLIKPGARGFSLLEQTARKGTQRLGSENFTPLDMEDLIDAQEGFGGLNSVVKGFVHGFDAFVNRMFTLRDDSFGGDAAALIGQSHQVELMNDLPEILTSSALLNKAKHIPTPVKALTAEDAFFKGLNYQLELPRATWRYVKTLYDDPKKIQDEFNKLMDPDDLDNRIPPNVLREAQEFAEVVTFTNAPDMESKFLGNMANGFMDLRNKNPFFKIIVPFFRTPANLMLYAKKNMLLSSKMYNEYGNNPKMRAEWNARAVASIGLFGAIKYVYDSGSVTGAGNPDKALREIEQKTGYAPSNSVKYKGKWYGLQRADPFGLTIGLMATALEYADASDENTNAADVVLGVLLESMSLTLERSMLRSISDLVSLADGNLGPGGTGDLAGLLTIIPTILQPGIVRSYRKMEDPYQRTMVVEGSTWNGIGNRMIKRMLNAGVGGSRNLPPRRDWRGQIKSYPGNAFVRGILPFNVVKPMDDKSTAAIVQYGVGLSRTSHKIQLPKSSWSINLLDYDNWGWIHNEYEKQIGAKRSEYMDVITGSKFFQKITSEIIKNGIVMDAPRYEAVKSKLETVMSKAKQDAAKEFLIWLDGRTEMKGNVLDDNNNREDIQFNRVFNISDYVDLEVAYQKGEPLKDFKKDLFTKTTRTLTRPAQGILESVTRNANEAIEF